MSPDMTDPQRALELIRWSHDQIRRHVHRTPVVECRSLSLLAGHPLRLKCENLQRGGAFKLRGALSRVQAFSAIERARGLIAPSSGNHAQGVALAARAVGTEATVVMPEDAPAIKIAAVRGYGAQIVFAGTTEHERRRRAEELATARGLAMVPAFDDPYVISGQGTVGLEIMEEWPDCAAIFVPIGGGGLISGIALAAAALGLGTKVIGVEPKGASRAALSLEEGRRVTLERVETIADGLRPLALGALNYEIIRRHVHDVVTVSDAAIVASMRLLLERAKLVAEPSGAIAVAAALEHASRFGGPVLAVVSGGNVDLGRMSQLLAPVGDPTSWPSEPDPRG